MKTKHTLDGITFDSQEELYFYLWLLEAKEAGYIHDFTYQSDPFILVPGINIPKLMSGGFDVTTFRPVTYKADFVIEINNKFTFLNHGLEYPSEHNKFYIDIKPGFTKQDSVARIFSIMQKLMLHKHGLYVNKVVIADVYEKDKKTGIKKLKTPGLFRRTWVPEGCAFKGKGMRREAYRECKLLKELSL